MSSRPVLALVRAVGAVLLLLSALPLAGAAAATDTRPITAKALTDHSCDNTEWHFVITGLHDDAQAPAFIAVVWADGSTANLLVADVTGGTAHYSTTSHLDSRVDSATAAIDSAWSGQFNLSHGPCGAPGSGDDDESTGGTGGSGATTSVTAQAPTAVASCAKSGALITVTAAAHVTYRLNGEVVTAGEHFVAADAEGRFTAVVRAEADAGWTLSGKSGWALSGRLDCAEGDGGSGSGSSDETVTIAAKALTDHRCDDSEWHFVITGLDDDTQAPTAITVTFSGGLTETVALDRVTGHTAHYTTTAHLDLEVTAAAATIGADWGGQFNLSHGPCADAGTGLPTTVTAAAATVRQSCDQDGVVVTIPTDAHVTYALNGTHIAAGDHLVHADQGQYAIVVTATADNGYALAGTTRWDLSGTLDCDTSNDVPVTPATPTIEESCAQHAAVVTIPATLHIAYTLNGQPATAGLHTVAANAGGHYTAVVAAVADAGYLLVGTSNWNLSGRLDCGHGATTVTAQAPTVGVDCAARGVVITIPATPHLHYTLNGVLVAAGTHVLPAPADGSYTVTVTVVADSGYTLTGPTRFTFAGTLACGTPAPGPAQVTVAPQPCVAGATPTAVVRLAVAADQPAADYVITRAVAGATATVVGTFTLPRGVNHDADIAVQLAEDTPVRITITTGATVLADVTLTANCLTTEAGGPTGTPAPSTTTPTASTTTPSTSTTTPTTGSSPTSSTSGTPAATTTTPPASSTPSTTTTPTTGVLGTKQGPGSDSGTEGARVLGTLADTGANLSPMALLAAAASLILLGLLMLTRPRQVLAGLTAAPRGKHHKSRR